MARPQLTLPYLVLTPADVLTHPPDGWTLRRTGDPGPGVTVRDSEPIESWDALASLELRRSFHFPLGLASRLQLDDSTTFALSVSTITAGGLLREILVCQPIPPEAPSVDITVVPRGRRLAKDLTLVAQLVVLAAVASNNPLAPSFSGARLWENRTRLRIETGRGRIPMEACDFSSEFPDQGFAHALFHVECTNELEHDVEEGLRVYLNTAHAAFISAIENAEPSAQAMLWQGIIRRVVAEALSGELSDEGAYPPGSIGANVSRWLKQAFPSMSVNAIRQHASAHPSLFEASIDSWLNASSGLFASPEGAR